MATFDITRKSGVVTLDDNRRASVRFTVTNLANRPMSVAFTAIPRGAADAGLFTFDKPAERVIEPNGSPTIDVLITADKKTAPGKYAFTLKVADVDQPDDYYGESQPVEFEVPAKVENGGGRRWGLIVAIVVAVAIVVGTGVWLLFRKSDEITFEQGYILPHFVTDIDGERVVLDNAKVLIYDQQLDALPTTWVDAGIGADPAPLLIIANFGERVRYSFEIGVAHGQLELGGKTIRLAAVALPDSGSRREDTLNRIAEFTGARVVSTEQEFSSLSDDALGRASRVVITDHRTTLCKNEESCR